MIRCGKVTNFILVSAVSEKVFPDKFLIKPQQTPVDSPAPVLEPVEVGVAALPVEKEKTARQRQRGQESCRIS